MSSLKTHLWTQAMGGLEPDESVLCGEAPHSEVKITFYEREVTCRRCRILLRLGKNAHRLPEAARREISNGRRPTRAEEMAARRS